jgi:hypothetical protein
MIYWVEILKIHHFSDKFAHKYAILCKFIPKVAICQLGHVSAAEMGISGSIFGPGREENRRQKTKQKKIIENEYSLKLAKIYWV